MSAPQIPVIGIVGGIGSGKSAVAQALSRWVRCCRLDADAAGHRALELNEVQQAIRNVFGDTVFNEQGRIQRSALASQVFGSSDQQVQSRRALEKIVHPIIRQDLQDQIHQHQAERDCDVLILDAALILESDWSKMCNAVVYLDVPREQRLERVKSRGWTSEELARREASQLPLDEKKRRSTKVIDNSGKLEETAARLAEWIRTAFSIKLKPGPEPVPN